MITPAKKEIASSPKLIRRKSAIREWFDSVLFAVIAATLIRWFFFEAFVIPSSSMEHTLLVGDYLFVSKLHYGTRTPVTPLQMPLTHQKIWGSEIPSFFDWISLPQFRLPGFSEVKRGDVVVFNLPVEHPNLYKNYEAVLPNLKPYPIDLRTNYIKRCVAEAGDKFEIRNSQVYVNGVKSLNPPEMQNEYFMAVTTAINEANIFRKNGITEFSPYMETQNDTLADNDEAGYIVKTTAQTAAKLKAYDFVKHIEKTVMPKGLRESHLYPESDLFNWNKDNYGPVVIPKKGVTVKLTPENVAFYGEVIQNYERNYNVVLKEGKIFQQGKQLEGYTFKQDYYFMMGDNRHNSADSRYWGLVPKDHIVGKAVFVWMSIDPDPVGFMSKIRWNRLFSIIK
ncbi:signal peptidase I [Dyadobacter sp. UP-52]|uniref:Signal peptidase I n=2 Tax=Dyadobacter subterraneus TaxID=2773304 RepID=A0ABR9WD84_9BACT|nr:signal peptidase I [Dyadobacter subterraneus]MBE9463089.1 signal peptidase I [Dyadobacter subterraneus]